MRFESRLSPADGWQVRHVPGASSSRRAVSWLEPPGGVELRIRRNRSGITTGHLWQPDVAFTYGWAMARMRFDHPAGAHTGWWLQTTEDYIVGQAELDVIEYFGHRPSGAPGRLQHAVHWRTAEQGVGEFTDRERPATVAVDPGGWHEYGLAWTPTSYVFSIDGVESVRITEPAALSGRPKVPVLSLLVSGWEEPRLDRGNLPGYRAQCDHVVIESA